MNKNFDSINKLTADQMRLLAAEHYEVFRKAIAFRIDLGLAAIAVKFVT